MLMVFMVSCLQHAQVENIKLLEIFRSKRQATTRPVKTLSTLSTSRPMTSSVSLPSTISSVSTTLIPTTTDTLLTELEVDLVKIFSPETVTTAEEIVINQNVSYSIDFADLFTQTDKLVPLLKKQLLITKKKWNEWAYFKDNPEYLYKIINVADTYSRMLKVCRKSQSEFFEPNSYSRIAELPNLLDRHNNSFGDKSFWLNVLITNAGNVQYHSDAPLSTVFENDPQLKVLPTVIEKGKCIIFNAVAKTYDKVSCTELNLAICFIEKTSEVLEKRSFYESLDDTIAALPRIKISQIDRNRLTKALKNLTPSECDGGVTKSLIQTVGYNEPSLALSLNTNTNPTIFMTLFPQLLNDITSIRELIRSSDFESKLKLLLQLGRDSKIIYDETKNLICSRKQKTSEKMDFGSYFESFAPKKEIFYQFNLTDLVLALTSVVIAIIAIGNSIYLLILYKCKGQMAHQNELLEPNLANSQHIPEMTKKVTFKTLQRKADKLKSRSPSIQSLPSPIPARN